jgi:hypothetical protein
MSKKRKRKNPRRRRSAHKRKSNPTRHKRRHGHARKNPTRRRRRRNPGMPHWVKGALIAGGLATATAVTAIGGEYLVANIIKPTTPGGSAAAYGISGLLLAMGFGMIPVGGVAAGIVLGTTFIGSALATLSMATKTGTVQGLGAGLQRDLMGRVIANDMAGMRALAPGQIGRVLANNMGGVSGLTAREIVDLQNHGQRLGLSVPQINALIQMHPRTLGSMN